MPQDYRLRMQLKQKRGHKERELDLQGVNGHEFRLILRKSDINPLDFSVVIAYCRPQSNQLFRLRRYNGKSHEHTNHIEGDRFYDFHIHTATQRYQELGTREDGYAEPATRYADYHTALGCLLSDCGIDFPVGGQISFLGEV